MHILDHIFMDIQVIQLAFFPFFLVFCMFFTCFSPLRLGNPGRFLLLSCQDPGRLALAGPGAGPSRAHGGPGAA